MQYEELRLEFIKQSFRENMINKLGNTCVNCGSVENIEYHHIVPLVYGGTNKMSNIVPLCVGCHFKAHKKTNAEGIIKAKEKGTIGRKHKMTYEECEPFLRQYFNLEIGKKECSEKCMYSSPKRLNESPYFKRFKEENNIPSDFKNNIDLKNAQEKRISKMNMTLDKAIPYLKKFYTNKINEEECRDLLGISKTNKKTWDRLIKEYDAYNLKLKEEKKEKQQLQKELQQQLFNKTVKLNHHKIEPFKGEPIFSVGSVVNSYLKNKINKQDALILLGFSEKSLDKYIGIHKVKYNIE